MRQVPRDDDLALFGTIHLADDLVEDRPAVGIAPIGEKLPRRRAERRQPLGRRELERRVHAVKPRNPLSEQKRRNAIDLVGLRLLRSLDRQRLRKRIRRALRVAFDRTDLRLLFAELAIVRPELQGFRDNGLRRRKVVVPDHALGLPRDGACLLEEGTRLVVRIRLRDRLALQKRRTPPSVATGLVVPVVKDRRIIEALLDRQEEQPLDRRKRLVGEIAVDDLLGRVGVELVKLVHERTIEPRDAIRPRLGKHGVQHLVELQTVLHLDRVVGDGVPVRVPRTGVQHRGILREQRRCAVRIDADERRQHRALRHDGLLLQGELRRTIQFLIGLERLDERVLAVELRLSPVPMDGKPHLGELEPHVELTASVGGRRKLRKQFLRLEESPRAVERIRVQHRVEKRIQRLRTNLRIRRRLHLRERLLVGRAKLGLCVRMLGDLAGEPHPLRVGQPVLLTELREIRENQVVLVLTVPRLVLLVRANLLIRLVELGIRHRKRRRAQHRHHTQDSLSHFSPCQFQISNLKSQTSLVKLYSSNIKPQISLLQQLVQLEDVIDRLRLEGVGVHPIAVPVGEPGEDPATAH